MKYQTNTPLGPFINHWGCHITSILEKVEKAGGVKFTNDDVLTVYYTGMAKGFIQREVFDSNGIPKDGCFILATGNDTHGDEIFNIGAGLLGVPFRATGYRKELANYTPNPGEEELLCLKRKGYDGLHFVAGNNKSGVRLVDEIEFDPVEGGSNCARTGWIDSKRILTIVKI
jgi:hypothetical protein